MTPMGSGLGTRWRAGFSRPATVARTVSTPKRSRSARDRSISRRLAPLGRVVEEREPLGPGPSPVRCRCWVFGARIAVLDIDRCGFRRLGVHGAHGPCGWQSSWSGAGEARRGSGPGSIWGLGEGCLDACGKPLRPSTTAIRMSWTAVAQGVETLGRP